MTTKRKAGHSGYRKAALYYEVEPLAEIIRREITKRNWMTDEAGRMFGGLQTLGEELSLATGSKPSSWVRLLYRIISPESKDFARYITEDKADKILSALDLTHEFHISMVSIRGEDIEMREAA